MMDRDRELHEMVDEGRALMSDYIKREDAINAVANTYWQGTDCECYAFARKALDNVPNADVAPVKHGRWVYKDEPIFGNPYGRYYCDLCEYGMADKENYCPNCGARMDGEENDD